MGIVVSSLVYPFMLLWIGFGVGHVILGQTVSVNYPLLAIDCINVVLGFLSFHGLGRSTAAGREIAAPVLRWLPIYWLLIAAAAWRALWQLHSAPFLWEKTPHSPAEGLPSTAALQADGRVHRNSWPEPMISASSLPITSRSRPL